MTGEQQDRVSAAEIAELTRRLRALTESERDGDAGERSVFPADKAALLDRITHHDHDDQAGLASGRETDMTSARQGRGNGLDDDDGWVAGGYEAAHQAHLDYLAEGGDRGADADDPVAQPAAQASEVSAPGAEARRWWETEAGQARIAQWARESALAEEGQRRGGAVDDPADDSAVGRADRWGEGLDYGDGWSR